MIKINLTVLQRSHRDIIRVKRYDVALLVEAAFFEFIQCDHTITIATMVPAIGIIKIWLISLVLFCCQAQKRIGFPRLGMRRNDDSTISDR